MSGRVGDLTSKQSEILKNFREKVKDILRPDDDDHYLLRWLRARNFDLKKSEIMLRNHVDWYQKMGIDTIREDFKIPEVIQKYEAGGLFGLDKDGCPVWVYPMGCLDSKGLLRSAKKSDLIKNKIVMLELLFDVFKEESKKFLLEWQDFEKRLKYVINLYKLGREISREIFNIVLIDVAKQGKIIDQVVIIHDMDHLGMKHLWKPGVDVFNELLTIYEDHYPELLKYGIIINAPKIFPIAFNLVKPFLSEETIRKTKIYGRNYKRELLKYINADQLPAHYGGTCSDPNGDPKCSSKIRYAGEVPRSYYCQLSEEEMENFTTITVKQGSSVFVDVDVPEANSALRWQFTTNGHDIKFGIYMKDLNSEASPSETVEFIPADRVNSHLVPEDGIITCKIPGKYVLKFDNSYSWIRSKKINYFVEVLKPDSNNTDIPTDLVSSESSVSLINTASNSKIESADNSKDTASI